MKTERYLLDAHIAVYVLFDRPELDRPIAKIFSDYAAERYISTVSVLEIIHLQKIGKIKPYGHR